MGKHRRYEREWGAFQRRINIYKVVSLIYAAVKGKKKWRERVRKEMIKEERDLID